MFAQSLPPATPTSPSPRLDRAQSPAAASAIQGQHCGPALSPREREILFLLIEGFTDKEIGAALRISPRTVTTHVTSIYNKMGVFCRVAATTYAFRHDLV